MYGLIRLVCGGLFCALALFALSRTKWVHKRVFYIVVPIVSVILSCALVFVPLENSFLTFDSPEAAYDYYTFGESEVKLVVDGKNSDLVIGDKSGTNVFLIVPKKADGWKTGIGIHTKQVKQKMVDGFVLSAYQYKDTDDYFVTIFDINGGELNITDSNESDFFSLTRENDALGKSFVTYYANVSSVDQSYWIAANEKVIRFE